MIASNVFDMVGRASDSLFRAATSLERTLRALGVHDEESVDCYLVNRGGRGTLRCTIDELTIERSVTLVELPRRPKALRFNAWDAARAVRQLRARGFRSLPIGISEPKVVKAGDVPDAPSPSATSVVTSESALSVALSWVLLRFTHQPWRVRDGVAYLLGNGDHSVLGVGGGGMLSVADLGSRGCGIYCFPVDVLIAANASCNHLGQDDVAITADSAWCEIACPEWRVVGPQVDDRPAFPFDDLRRQPRSCTDRGHMVVSAKRFLELLPAVGDTAERCKVRFDAETALRVAATGPAGEIVRSITLSSGNGALVFDGDLDLLRECVSRASKIAGSVEIITDPAMIAVSGSYSGVTCEARFTAQRDKAPSPGEAKPSRAKRVVISR